MTTDTTTHRDDLAAAVEILVTAVRYQRAALAAATVIRREVDAAHGLRQAIDYNLRHAERLVDQAIDHAQGMTDRE